MIRKAAGPLEGKNIRWINGESVLARLLEFFCGGIHRGEELLVFDLLHTEREYEIFEKIHTAEKTFERGLEQVCIGDFLNCEHHEA